MKKMSFLLIIAVSTILILTQIQCGKTIKGCTDKEAESYNPDADENDPTLCVYARDKFLGEYTGDLTCLANLAPLINGMTDFIIAETTDDKKVVDITINAKQVLRFNAVVSGNDLLIDNTIPNITILLSVYTLKAKGKLTLSADKKTIAGDLFITLLPAGLGLPIEDTCNISGTKK